MDSTKPTAHSIDYGQVKEYRLWIRKKLHGGELLEISRDRLEILGSVRSGYLSRTLRLLCLQNDNGVGLYEDRSDKSSLLVSGIPSQYALTAEYTVPLSIQHGSAIEIVQSSLLASGHFVLNTKICGCI